LVRKGKDRRKKEGTEKSIEQRGYTTGWEPVAGMHGLGKGWLGMGYSGNENSRALPSQSKLAQARGSGSGHCLY
jgi:hypothetical protein